MLQPPASNNLYGASPAAASSALAQTLALHEDQTILQALLLLISQRPGLQASLLNILQEPPAQRYCGVIKSFWVEKHYGFIQCDELKEQFESDVFLSDLEIGSFVVGSVISFSVMLNKDGRPQAKMLEAMEADYKPAAAFRMPPQIQTSRQMPSPPPVPPARPPQKRAATSSEEVLAPAFKKPRFHMALAPPPAPAPVRPEPPLSAAEGLTPLRPPAQWSELTDPQAAEVHLGSIKTFWPEKHYGFIDCPAFQQSHGCDVFLSDFEVSEFQPGDSVAFTVTYNRNGRPQAHQLQQAEF